MDDVSRVLPTRDGCRPDGVGALEAGGWMSMETKFWKPEPREPWSDWRMYGILVPILISASGFFVTGIFAFAFSDLAVIPAATQSWLVIFGSALIIFGAELNTPFTIVEVYRKILRKEANGWDISALISSCAGTMINLLVTFASRLSLDPAWKMILLNWGPLLSGMAVACDYYGSLVELGFLFGSFEIRMETWLEERRVWQTENKIVTFPSAPEPDELVFDKSWPKADPDEFMEWAVKQNGARASLTPDDVTKWAHARQVQDPSLSTRKRWVKAARKG